MEGKKQKRLMTSLIVVIAVLVALVLYAFVIQPSITNYAIEMQNEGITYAVVSIMEQASGCDVVPLTYGNTTMNLVWVDCLQAE